MNKLISILASFSVAIVANAGGLNTYDGVEYTNLLVASRVPAGTAITGTACNVASLKGNGTVVFSVSPGNTNTTTYGASVQVQDSETGTTAWSNVTALVATGYTNVGTLSKVKLDTATVRKYLRIVATATNDSAVVSGVLVAYP